MPYKNKTFIRNYADCARLYNTCRDPKKGKPLSNWGRIFKRDQDFYITCHGLEIGKISPDDTFEFTITPQQGATVSVTLAGSMHYCTPIVWTRVATQRYRVCHEKTYLSIGQIKRETNSSFSELLRDKAPELFVGLKIDLSTGEPVNRRPDIMSTLNTDARKVWLSKLRMFKRGLRIRAKMGVFDSIYKELSSQTNFPRELYSNRPDWTSDQWTNEVYKAIETDQFPTELIRAFVVEATPRWRPKQPSLEDNYRTIDSVLTRMSLNLRIKFGVFQSTQGEAA